jgi:ubiquinone/menaquinone biosynthesis C-methylase UbiE
MATRWNSFYFLWANKVVKNDGLGELKIMKSAASSISSSDVFGRIASRYDVLCDLFSLGIHRLWKREVAQVIAKEPWLRLLDCATGTGDIILRVLNEKQIQDNQKLIASDISPQMLAIAQKRLTAADSLIEFHVLDAHFMPDLPAESIDLYSIYGLKMNAEEVLREISGLASGWQARRT